MTYQIHSEDRFSKIPWLHGSHINCDECRAGLSDYLERSLAGLPSEQDAIPLHLESCPNCSWLYIDLLDLTTAMQVQQLMDSWVEPPTALSTSMLKGLLVLWQLQLGAAERVNNRKASARGLSLMGIIHRLLNDLEEARLVHALALRTAEESDDLFSRMISYADLGYIALSGQRSAEALGHLRRAAQSAKQLTDDENEARIHLLLGQAWEQQGDWANAQSEYGIANESALAANRADFAKLAQQKERKMAMRLVANRLLDGFYSLLLQPRESYAPGGDKILVVNLAKEIPIEIIFGPQLNREGEVTLSLTLDRDVLNDLPEKFFIELIFLPTIEVLQTVVVDPAQREVLPIGGLEIKAKIPSFERYLEQLHFSLQQERLEYWQLPKTAFPLLIRWEE